MPDESKPRGITIPTWVVSLMATLMAAAMLGAYGWIWNVNSDVVELQTEMRILKESAKDDLSEIKEDVKEIRKMLIDFIRDSS